MEFAKVNSGRLQRLLPKGGFAKGVGVMASGAVAGQAILLLSSPILTRIYSPEQFGVLAVFAALLGTFSAVAGLRYELAIPLPRSDRRAVQVLVLSLIMVGAVTVLTAILVALCNARIATWTKTPELEYYLWLLPIGVAATGAYQTVSQWATRVKAFSRLSLTRLQRSGAIAASQIGLGLGHHGSLGLIAGQVIGAVVGLLGFYKLLGTRKLTMASGTSLIDLLAAAKRHKRFPIYASWATLINAVGNQLPPIALAVFFSPAAAGFYMIAQRVGSRPLVVIGDSVRNVFFSNAAIAHREGDITLLTFKAFRGLLLIAALPIAVMAFIAPSLFAIVFGAEWAQAGLYLRWLTPWLLTQFVVSPLTSIFYIAERQSRYLMLQTVLAAVRVLSFGCGVYFHSVALAIILFGISSAFVFMLFGASVLRLAGIRIRRVATLVLQELLIISGVLILMALTKQIIVPTLSSSVLAVQDPLLLCVAAPAVVWRVWRATHQPATKV